MKVRMPGLERFSGLYLWGGLILVFTLLQPGIFFTSDTAHSVAADRAVSAMLALAVIVALACGVFDLSIGAIANFSTITAVLLINRGMDWPLVVVLSILVATCFGAVNALVVTKLHVSSFITTLGTASVITALQIIITENAQPSPPFLPSWSAFTQTTVLGFQVIVAYMLVLAVVVWWALEHTPVGRYLYAIGSSPEAARLSGVPVERYTALSLIASATIAGIAGAFYASLAGPSLTYGSSLLLPAFAAAFLGSTQIVPGRFNVWGTVMAIYVLATGVKGLQLTTNAQWLDPMFSGAALVLAVAVAIGRQRAGEERTRKRLAEEGDAEREARLAGRPTPSPGAAQPDPADVTDETSAHQPVP